MSQCFRDEQDGQKVSCFGDNPYHRQVASSSCRAVSGCCGMGLISIRSHTSDNRKLIQLGALYERCFLSYKMCLYCVCVLGF